MCRYQTSFSSCGKLASSSSQHHRHSGEVDQSNSAAAPAVAWAALQDFCRHINTTAFQLAASGMLHDEATQALAWTLHNIVTLLQQQEQENPLVEDSDDENEDLVLSSVENDVIQVKALLLQDTPSQQQGGNPLVFGHPFIIAQVDHSQTASTNSSGLAALAAVALYNLGLALHQKAIHAAAGKSPEDATTSVLCQQAANLYQQAYELLDQRVLFLNPEGSLMYVYLALCNNLAEALQVAQTDSRTWQNALYEALRTIPPPQDNVPVYDHFVQAIMAYRTDF